MRRMLILLAFASEVALAKPHKGEFLCIINYTPSGHQCKFQGTVNDNKVQPYNTVTDLQLDQCSQFCLDQARCREFSLDNAGSCNLYNSSIKTSPPSKSTTSDVYFYNRACFTRQYNRYQAMRNPGFETGKFRKYIPTLVI